MDMELAKRAVISLPKIIAYKIKFGGRFHAPMIHALGRHSYMVIKKMQQNRRKGACYQR